jgi:beta-glucanase (GH16 family)
MYLFNSDYGLWRSCFLMFLGFGCAAITHPALAQSPPSSEYTLAWSNNFPGTIVDSTKWMWRMGLTGESAQLATNVVLDGAGNMNITNLTQPNVIGTTQFTGGGLMSLATFRFGYFQVTAQTPVDTGWHTSFWLSGGADSDESWNPVPQTAFTEIDGFQIDSQNPTQTETDWIPWTDNKAGTTSNCTKTPYELLYNSAGLVNSSTGSHTYGIEWTETGINYYVDNSMFCQQLYSAATNVASPVNILLTSIADGSSAPTTPSNPEATFSNPQFYLRDYYVNAEDTGYAEYGSGWTNSTIAGFSSQPVRAACYAGDSAIYTPGILNAGSYQVYVYNVVGSGTDTDTAVTINTSAGPQIANPLTSTVSQWVNEGIYSFAVGDASNVVLTRGNNCLEASMVKFCSSTGPAGACLIKN